MAAVSVIMPVYNVALYLDQCLQSVVRQTLWDIEIFCIDDNSTDGSQEILKRYALADKRIRLFFNVQNIGAAKSRNIAIDKASGEYIAFLDSDDYFDLKMLEKLYKLGKENSADLVACNYNYVDEIDGTIKEHTVENIPYSFKRKLDSVFKVADIYGWHREVIGFYPWAKLIRRNLITGHNLYFQDIPVGNDIYFSTMVMRLAKRVIYTDRGLVYYRYHRTGQLSVRKGKNSYLIYEALVKIEEKTSQYGNEVYAIPWNDTVEYLHSTLRKINKFSQRKFLRFLGQTGWWKLKLARSDKYCFFSTRDYIAWLSLKKSILLGNYERIDKSDVFAEGLTANLFEFLKGLKYTCCLWGYGKRGRLFHEVATSYNFRIGGIIDQASSLNNTPIGDILIHPIEEQNGDFDLVLVTNSSFVESIVHKLQSLGKTNIKVMDIELIISYNIPMSMGIINI